MAIPATADSGHTLCSTPPLSGVVVPSSAPAASAAAAVCWPVCPCVAELHLSSSVAALPVTAAGACTDPPCWLSWCELPRDPSSPTQNPPCMLQPTRDTRNIHV